MAIGSTRVVCSTLDIDHMLSKINVEL